MYARTYDTAFKCYVMLSFSESNIHLLRLSMPNCVSPSLECGVWFGCENRHTRWNRATCLASLDISALPSRHFEPFICIRHPKNLMIYWRVRTLSATKNELKCCCCWNFSLIFNGCVLITHRNVHTIATAIFCNMISKCSELFVYIYCALERLHKRVLMLTGGFYQITAITK